MNKDTKQILGITVLAILVVLAIKIFLAEPDKQYLESYNLDQGDTELEKAPLMDHVPGYPTEEEVMNSLPVGMPIDEVFKKYGKPDSTMETEEKDLVYFWDWGFSADRSYRYEWAFSGFSVIEVEGKVFHVSAHHMSANW